MLVPSRRPITASPRCSAAYFFNVLPLSERSRSPEKGLLLCSRPETKTTRHLSGRELCDTCSMSAEVYSVRALTLKLNQQVPLISHSYLRHSLKRVSHFKRSIRVCQAFVCRLTVFNLPILRLSPAVSFGRLEETAFDQNIRLLTLPDRPALNEGRVKGRWAWRGEQEYSHDHRLSTRLTSGGDGSTWGVISAMRLLVMFGLETWLLPRIVLHLSTLHLSLERR